MLQQVKAQQLREVTAQRHSFFHETAHLEIAYSFLETSRGRLSELEKVVLGSSTLRVESAPLSPSSSAEIALTEVGFIAEQLQTSAVTLKRFVQAQEECIEKEYRYNLVTYNCATELVHSLNKAFANSAAECRDLSGCLEAEPGLNFVPFIFYERVRTTFGLNQQEILPSRRLRQLSALYEKENSLKVWLRFHPLGLRRKQFLKTSQVHASLRFYQLYIYNVFTPALVNFFK